MTIKTIVVTYEPDEGQTTEELLAEVTASSDIDDYRRAVWVLQDAFRNLLKRGELSDNEYAIVEKLRNTLTEETYGLPGLS